MNHIQEIDLVQKVFSHEINWDNLILENDNVISSASDTETLCKMIESFDILALESDNKLGYSLLRNQLTFVDTIGDSLFIIKSKYDKIVGIGANPKNFEINYPLELKKYPP